MKRHVVFVSHCERAGWIRIISARLATRTGKYYDRATAGTNLVLIEPDLANLLPDSESVNRALRLLADTAQAATPRKLRRTRG